MISDMLSVRIVSILFFITSIILILIRISLISIDCSSLDAKKLNFAVVSKFLNSNIYPTISLPTKDGGRASFSVVPYSGVEEYLRLHPDCCHYYAGTIHKERLSFWERFGQARCGSVTLVAHIQYLSNGDLKVVDLGSSAWLVNQNYELILDTQGR